MSSGPQLNPQDTDELEAAVDQAIAARGGDMRSTIRRRECRAARKRVDSYWHQPRLPIV